MFVDVGAATDHSGGPLQFIPNTINAVTGTDVIFRFSGMYVMSSFVSKLGWTAKLF